jgi:RNA polymerase sigma-70 factor (family 1)
MQENTLIERAKTGDNRAFQALVNQWYAKIYNFALKYFGDESLASEVAQCTFITVYQHLPKLQHTDKFKAWLYQIANNHCHDEQRKRQKRWSIAWLRPKKAEEDAEEISIADTRTFANPESEFQQKELVDLLQKALHRLPEEQKTVVIMKEYEGFKFQEIAEILQISENTAKSRLYYGLKALRKQLETANYKIEDLVIT